VDCNSKVRNCASLGTGIHYRPSLHRPYASAGCLIVCPVVPCYLDVTWCQHGLVRATGNWPTSPWHTCCSGGIMTARRALSVSTQVFSRSYTPYMFCFCQVLFYDDMRKWGLPSCSSRLRVSHVRVPIFSA